MIEIWKPIANFENYEISNYGRVKSLNYNHANQERILVPEVTKKGYLRICLSKNNIKYKFRIHRLVAEAFIQNPDNLPQVNHKDEDKINNCVDNLEWCDNKYNNNYGTKIERAIKTRMNKLEVA